MKKFQFTLKKMLGYKEQIADREKNTLAALRIICDKIQANITRLEEAFTQNALALREEQAFGITRAELMAYDNRMKDIRNQIKRLKQELEIAQRDVEVQLEVVIVAVKEVSTLEKLEEHQREEYDKLVQKEEELYIEEYITSETVRKKIS